MEDGEEEEEEEGDEKRECGRMKRGESVKRTRLRFQGNHELHQSTAHGLPKRDSTTNTTNSQRMEQPETTRNKMLVLSPSP